MCVCKCVCPGSTTLQGSPRVLLFALRVIKRCGGSPEDSSTHLADAGALAWAFPLETEQKSQQLGEAPQVSKIPVVLWCVCVSVCVRVCVSVCVCVCVCVWCVCVCVCVWCVCVYLAGEGEL